MPPPLRPPWLLSIVLRLIVVGVSYRSIPPPSLPALLPSTTLSLRSSEPINVLMPPPLALALLLLTLLFATVRTLNRLSIPPAAYTLLLPAMVEWSTAAVDPCRYNPPPSPAFSARLLFSV